MQATSSGDDENDGGIGGGVFNREGLVRFKGNATFVGNYAQASTSLSLVEYPHTWCHLLYFKSVAVVFYGCKDLLCVFVTAANCNLYRG